MSLFEEWRGAGAFVDEDLPAHRQYYAGLFSGAAVVAAVHGVAYLASQRVSTIPALVIAGLALAVGASLVYRPA